MIAGMVEKPEKAGLKIEELATIAKAAILNALILSFGALGHVRNLFLMNLLIIMAAVLFPGPTERASRKCDMSCKDAE